MSKRDLFNSATIESRLAKPGSKWHRDPPDVIPLWLADTDFETCPELKEGLLKAVEDGDIIYNTDTVAREAMSKKLKRINKIDVPPSQIMVTQGIIPGMWLSVKHACQPGDQVIVTDPMYFPFFRAASVVQTQQVRWKLDLEDRYEFDIEKLKELITPKTKLINVCNPHNPAGRAMTKEELKGIADIAVDNGIYVYSDELWEDIRYDGREHISIASLNDEIADLTITSSGFSKTWSIPGLQIAYISCTSVPLFESLMAIGSGVLRGTNTLAKAIAPMMLDGSLDYYIEGMIEQLVKIRDLTTKRLNEMADVTIPTLEATYLMFPKFNYGLGSVELNKIFKEEAKVAFNPGHIFGPSADGHMRILTATSEAIMNEALDRMEKVIPLLEKKRK